jgi:hypothetical protein
VRLAPARDQDLLAGCGALHVVAEVIAELVGANLTHRRIHRSGASGTRTHDLLTAGQALSQLSYGPGELVVGGKVNGRPLRFRGAVRRR